MPARSPVPADAGDGTDPVPAGDTRPFIPVESRPAVVEDLAKTAWQVAAALEVWETARR